MKLHRINDKHCQLKLRKSKRRSITITKTWYVARIIIMFLEANCSPNVRYKTLIFCSAKLLFKDTHICIHTRTKKHTTLFSFYIGIAVKAALHIYATFGPKSQKSQSFKFKKGIFNTVPFFSSFHGKPADTIDAHHAGFTSSGHIDDQEAGETFANHKCSHKVINTLQNVPDFFLQNLLYLLAR